MKKITYKQKGFMVLEILVAAAIIAMSVLAASNVAQKSINVSRQAFHSAQAAFLLEEGAELVRVIRDNAWSGISSLTSGVEYYPMYCKLGDPNSDSKCIAYAANSFWILVPMNNSDPYYLTNQSVNVGRFIRKIVISDVYRDATTQDIVSSGGNLDAGTKLVTVTVSWAQGSATVTKTLLFYLANIFS
ncbi:MAG: hypothetical protein M3Q34_03210 [bacterium]|nr:hypothetical protein [bacterium]